MPLTWRAPGAFPGARRPFLPPLIAGVVFLVLVTGNSAGYRFGVSDQAFYLPAIQAHLDPGSFPRDQALIEGQARLLLLDDGLAVVAAATGISLPALFAGAYALSGIGLGAALFGLARTFGLGPWSVAAFVLAMTLRHHVLGTGVNTFEGYFHPRVLAFALGLFAVGAFARGRHAGTVVFVVLATAVHPTTALWFAGWIVASVVARQRLARDASPRRILAVVALLFLPLGLLAAAGGLWPSLTLHMDETWLALLESRDYLFPTRWPFSTWLAHVAIVGMLMALAWWRRTRGASSPTEWALMVGCLALTAGFVLSLPFVAARLALAVQLQVSRVLWIVDVVATLLLVWAIAEAPWSRASGPPSITARSWRPVVLAGVLAVASVSRAFYSGIIEHPERAFVRVGLAPSAWVQALAWIRSSTPRDAHVLADPGHAWKYGTSVRIGAGRDVYLEEVKDAAMALYARDTADRVRNRIAAMGDFTLLTPERLSELDRRFDLDYLICETAQATRLHQPVVWERDGFSVVSLQSARQGY